MAAACCHLMRGAQGIAAATNGADQIRHFSLAVRFVNGFAQAAEMHINRAFFNIHAMPLDKIEKLCAAKHLTRTFDKYR